MRLGIENLRVDESVYVIALDCTATQYVWVCWTNVALKKQE